ncbi:hypothetical protein H8356DRAFT_1431462 [Neocallimastix lanati (nom. inval.)]|nr:hypothetical protein H8356DRAFT_1431462 [Neocallimastix sp. JGI-2020a]
MQLGEMQHFNNTPLGEMQSGEMQSGEMQLSHKIQICVTFLFTVSYLIRNYL